MKRRKIMFSTKNREAWSLFLATGYWDHLQARRLTPALRDGADLESSVNPALKLKRRPILKPSLPTSRRLRWAGRARAVKDIAVVVGIDVPVVPCDQ